MAAVVGPNPVVRAKAAVGTVVLGRSRMEGESDRESRLRRGAGEMGLVEGVGSCAEMRENQLDDCAVFDTRDNFERAGKRWHGLMSILNTCLSRCIQGPLLYQKTMLSILRLIFCYRHLLPYWIFSSVPSSATDIFFVIK